MEIKIGIVGARTRNEYTDFQKLVAYLENLLDKIERDGNTYSFVSGGCSKGADRFAEIIAEKYNIPIKIFYPAVNKTCSKSEYAQACSKRNILIAEYSNELIALTDPAVPNKKGGTNQTVKVFQKFHNKKAMIV